MEADGQSPYSINRTRKILEQLNHYTNLNNPEEAKAFIANHKVTNATKKHMVYAYDKYAKYYDIQWTKPKYKPQSKAVKVPTKEKVETLINSARQPLCLKLRISAETGMRPVEVFSLKVKDVDLDKGLFYPTTAKNGKPRNLKMSTILKDQLKDYITHHNLAQTDNLFTGNAPEYGKHFREYRNRLANKLKDPTLRTIRLYDLRHYFCTTTYYKTKDILFTMAQMGHSSLATTMIYAHLLDVQDDNWTCRTAKDINEASQLIEAGFEYVTEMDGIKLFKKRK
jgi:integrase